MRQGELREFRFPCFSVVSVADVVYFVSSFFFFPTFNPILSNVVQGPSTRKKAEAPVYLSDSEEDEDMIDEHHDESSSSDLGSDGEARVGRGSKRKARPLGSRWVAERYTCLISPGCSGWIVRSSKPLTRTILVGWRSLCEQSGVHPVQ